MAIISNASNTLQPGSSRLRGKFQSRRILYRIILPFTLLFAAIAICSWLFSTSLTGRFLDDNLRQQLTRVANVISRSSYVLNPMILQQMKEIVHADIVVSDGHGHLLHDTLADSPTADEIRELIKNTKHLPSTTGKKFVFQGQPYSAVIEPLRLPDQGPAFLSLWMPMDEAEQLQQKIFLATGWLAGVGVLAMAVLGYLIARSITLPVEELAALTGKIAAGDFNQRATVRHHDEVGALAQSFNQMLSQVQSYEQKLIESEKIGTAGQMAAGLAHEIRNPLTSIKLFIQILQGRLQDQPDNQAMTDAILQEVCRLERIIEQIVARARPSAPVMIRGNINDPLNEVLHLAAPSLQSAGITVQSHLDEPLPSCLHDPEKVKQVFWNLLLNSKDAMPKGGRLEIFSAVTANGIDITFADSGCGLSDTNPDLCFKAFYTTKPEGLGLGLSTSRKIMEQHGGTLTLRNGEQGGVIARIHLPIGATPENS